MNFVETVSVLIPCVLTLAMANNPMFITPIRKTIEDVVLVGKNCRPWSDRHFQYRSDRLLLNVRQHPHHDLAFPLNRPKDGRLVFLQRAATTRPFQVPSAVFTPFFLLLLNGL